MTIGGMGLDSTVELNIESFDPSVTNVVLTGRFSASDAQEAIDIAGSSFTMSWDMSWDQDGTAVELSADQIMSGTNWT